MRTRMIRFIVCLAALLSLLAGCDSRNGSPTTDGGTAGDLEIGSRTPPASTMVIFVHGVLGNATETFGHDKANNWPAMLVTDPGLPSSPDVLSVGYLSSPIRPASNINEIAARILSRLRDKDVFKSHKQVVFVVHSMGGLITKRMLVQLKAESPAEFERIAAVFFLATPAGGSTLAQTAAWISENPQFRDMKPIDVNTLLQVYEDDWQALLHNRQQSPYPKAFCAYETQPTGNFHVVPRGNAQAGCDEHPIAFDRDHLGIVKPASRGDEVYQFVLARLKRVMSGHYLPLTLRAETLVGDGTVLPPNRAMHSGDQFALRIVASKPAWYYVVTQDGSGKIERLFPSRQGGQQAAALDSIRLPAKSSEMLQLDRQTGVETIYIFASSERSPEIEKLHAEVETVKNNEAQQLLNTALQTRGITVAPNRGERPTHDTPPQFDAGSVGAEAVLKINIAHL